MASSKPPNFLFTTRRTMSPLPVLIWLLYLMTTVISVGEHHQKQCFYPSGGLASNTPCRNDTEVTHCCAYGYFCLSNGLCKPGPSNENLYISHFHRGGCTDQTWQSKDCPNVCKGVGDNVDATMGLAVCDEDKGIFCCQRDYDCCANPTLHLYLGKGEPIRFLARPTSAAAPNETDAESSGSQGKKKNGKDLVVGVASGFSIAAGLAIISWISILIFRRRMLLKRGTTREKKQDDETGTSTMGFGKAELDATETAGDAKKSEWRAGGSKNPVELDTEGNGRSELETIPTPGTRSTVDTAWTVSPMTATATSPRSLIERDYFATLITPVVLELPVEEKLEKSTDVSPSSPRMTTIPIKAEKEETEEEKKDAEKHVEKKKEDKAEVEEYREGG